MKRRRGGGKMSLSNLQSITSCFIMSGFIKSNWKRRPCCWCSEPPQKTLKYFLKVVGYVRSRHYEFIASVPCAAPCRISLELSCSPRGSTNSLLDCTLIKLLPDMHSLSQNSALATVLSDFVPDGINLVVVLVPCCSYRSLPLPHPNWTV